MLFAVTSEEGTTEHGSSMWAVAPAPPAACPAHHPAAPQVRETVLRLLHQLPVDCSLEDRKEQLKRSGLGRIVMFLFKVPGEAGGGGGGVWGGVEQGEQANMKQRAGWLVVGLAVACAVLCPLRLPWKLPCPANTPPPPTPPHPTPPCRSVSPQTRPPPTAA